MKNAQNWTSLYGFNCSTTEINELQSFDKIFQGNFVSLLL